MKKVYFTHDFIDFFKELGENNNKVWFDEQKSRYESVVKLPFLNFVIDALQVLNSISPLILPDPKKCVFRINRDVRFSADKSPYKNHASAVLSEDGTKGNHKPSFYIDFSDKSVFIGGGAYFIDNKMLPLVREFIAENYNDFISIIEANKFKSFYGKIQGEENKKLTGNLKGLEKEFPLILKKQYYYMKTFDSSILLDDKLMQKLKEGLEAGLDFNNFMTKAVNYKG